MYIDCKDIIYTICTKSLRKRTTMEQKCIKTTKIVQTVQNELRGGQTFDPVKNMKEVVP